MPALRPQRPLNTDPQLPRLPRRARRIRRTVALTVAATAFATLVGTASATPTAGAVTPSATVDAVSASLTPASAVGDVPAQRARRKVQGRNAAMPLPGPDKRRTGGGSGDVGFSPGFSIIYQPTDELRSDLRAMYRLGARRLRLDLSWAITEPSRGTYDWYKTDRVINEARRAGLRVLAIIGYEPDWATGSPNVDAAAWSSWVDAATRRYADTVSAWEIWNEPNLSRFWRGGPNPEAYAKVVATAAPVIRSNDPRAKIVTGALAPATDTGTELSPETFLRRFYAAIPDHDVFDAISVHPYSYPAMPDGAEAWNTFFRIPQIRDVAVRAGHDDVKVWLTEYGAPTGLSDRSVAPEVQAQMLVRAIKAARQMEGVGPIFLYSYRDVDDALNDPESNFGIVQHDGTAKSSYRMLRRMLNR
ncbi:hypothetical protein GCM10023340_04460 [Nocardioides marinquilinus]|uniref:Glycoside hydrolase family 5 domain-containing protein n=1 Tax=Nocardioides marinquilinus TaxID=1210400 RepID=A0ABP9P745_9ACTN